MRQKQQGLRHAALWIVVACLMAVAGCSTKYTDLKHFSQSHEQDVSATNYRIEPPDVVAINSPNAPEVDGTMQMVRSDGKISLKLLGEVKVSGLTPRELAAKIEELLARYYVSPQVNVQVSAYNSKNIYVFGQVGTPGKLAYTGRDTVMDIVARSQPTFLAWRERVQVIRPSASEGERHVITVDVEKITQTGDLQQNFLLKEGDIVYVPPTPLAWFGLKVRELFWPFEPVYSAYTGGAQARTAYDVWAGNTGRGDSSDDRELRRQALMLMLR
ncbi:MAG: polysaccharide export protein [Phycisphaerae bacterium]|nr:polysaccharide export protein [Phycisphaerae bacterium]